MGLGFQGLGFGLQGLGFRVWVSGFRVWVSGFQGLGCRVWVSGLGLSFFKRVLQEFCLLFGTTFSQILSGMVNTQRAFLKRFRLFPKRLPWKSSSLFLRIARFSVARHIPETALLVSRALGCTMVRSLSLRLFCFGGIC